MFTGIPKRKGHLSKMDSDLRLDGKTAVVTGANTGIGKQTALELAARGARVVLACRNEERANQARDEIAAETGNHNVVVMVLDLASQASVRRFAQEYNKSEDRLDLLVCNAGVAAIKRQVTEDGLELMFGVNHIGHFLLTRLLLDKLKKSAPSRIVIVASDAHRVSPPVDFNDLQNVNSFKAFKTYGQSKSCNILFGVELAQRLKDTSVSVYTVHPGLVDTDLSRDIPMLPCCFKCVVSMLSCTAFKSPHSGAETTLYCCLEPSIAGHSGKYYSECKECTPKSFATDPDTALRLWDESLKLCHEHDEDTDLSDKKLMEKRDSITEALLSVTCNNNLTPQDIVLEEKADLPVTRSKVVLVE